MFTQIRIINIRLNIEKIINIKDYNPTDLNIICDFYENHKDYAVERI
jgi:hypothetical protein